MKKHIAYIVLLSLLSCNSAKIDIDKSLLPGYWITLDKSNLGSDKYIVDRDFYIILDSGTEIDSIPLTYKLKYRSIVIYKGANWISKNEIIKLTKDTLIYKRKGDNVISKYVRKK